MRKAVIATLIACLIQPVTASSGAAEKDRPCTVGHGYPNFELDYTRFRMSVGLRFDLRRCWRDSGDFNAFAGWTRNVAYTKLGDIDGWLSSRCSGNLGGCLVSIDEDHSPIETATYRLKFFYPPSTEDPDARQRFRTFAIDLDCQSNWTQAECQETRRSNSLADANSSIEDRVRSIVQRSSASLRDPGSDSPSNGEANTTSSGQYGPRREDRVAVSTKDHNGGMVKYNPASGGRGELGESAPLYNLLSGEENGADRNAHRSDKKEKKPKPYKSDEELIQTGTGGLSVTHTEFLETCNPRDLHTQGLDAYVFEVPPQYRGYYGAMIEWDGRTESPLGYELFPYFYDKECAQGAYFYGSVVDEETLVLLPWTRFVVLESRRPLPAMARIRIRPATSEEMEFWEHFLFLDDVWNDPKCNIDLGYPDVEFEYTSSKIRAALTFDVERCWTSDERFYTFATYSRSTPFVDSDDDEWAVVKRECRPTARKCSVIVEKEHPESELAGYYLRFIVPYRKRSPDGSQAHLIFVFSSFCESTAVKAECI